MIWTRELDSVVPNWKLPWLISERLADMASDSCMVNML
jgi:hypothetical protein